MKGSSAVATSVALAMLLPTSLELRAQDIPGLEICTAEKAMDRRTSCLQSNVEFLQRAMSKQSADHQRKLDAANRQIDSLKATVADLQKMVADLQAAQKQTADDLKKRDGLPPPKERTPAKDGTK